MFYLWICAANLPIVVNETERAEQAAVINRLQQLLEKNNARSYNRDLDVIPFTPQPRNMFNRGVFTVSMKEDIPNKLKNNFKTPKPFINNFN